jgi:Ni/Co efflux regulator RcnB
LLTVISLLSGSTAVSCQKTVYTKILTPSERLPLEYRHRNFVVNNWQAHHLSPPPRGYHLVQIGSDYVLIAIATGTILQLMLSN